MTSAEPLLWLHVGAVILNASDMEGPGFTVIVVTVEQKAEARIENLIAGGEVLQDHLLEEPGRMGDVPSGGGHVNDRLRNIVLCFERFAQLLGPPPNGCVEIREGLSFRRSGRCCRHPVHFPILPRAESTRCLSHKARNVRIS